jgi:hypothetical protein
MKLIDDKKYAASVEDCLDFAGSNQFRMHLGKLSWNLPKTLVYQMLEKRKSWEADDISDVIKNYNLIDEFSFNIMNLPDNFALGRKAFEDAFKALNPSPADMQEIFALLGKQNELSKALNTELGIKNGFLNFNQVSLDNIYLGDFRFCNNEMYTKCDMIVKDKYSNRISAVVICPTKLFAGEINESLESSLSLIKSYKDYSTAFDIQFKALPLYKNDCKPVISEAKEDGYIGPRLEITLIEKTCGEISVSNPVNVDEYVPERH